MGAKFGHIVSEAIKMCKESTSSLTPEERKHLEETMKRYDGALKELAKR